MPTLSPKTTPYYGGGQVVNPANVIQTSGAPSANIDGGLGTLAVDNATGTIYGLASKSGGSATWAVLGGGSSDVSSLTGNSGGVISPSGGTITLSGGTLTNFVGSGSTLTLTPKSNGYPITPYVVGPSGKAGYQTIQSALDAANTSGVAQMIYVMPGTYTENLVFPNISISLWGDRGANSIIVGQHTPSASSNLELHALLFESATDVLNSSAAGTASIEISDSFILVTDGYVFNLPNWTGELLLDDCGEASTNDGVVNNTAGAPIKFLNTEMGAGSSRVMTLTGNANVRFDTCNVNCPVNIGGSGELIMQNGCKFANTVTIGGSKTGTIVSTDFLTGANQALVYSSSGNTYLSGITINSSNNPSIGGAGSGILTLGDITFPSNAVIAGTLTLAWAASKTGNLTSTGIQVKSGSNARIGVGAVLVGGTLAVANTSVTANTVVMVSVTTLGTVTTAKAVHVTKSAGVGFTVTSADATDTSTFDWYLVEAV